MSDALREVTVTGYVVAGIKGSLASAGLQASVFVPVYAENAEAAVAVARREVPDLTVLGLTPEALLREQVAALDRLRERLARQAAD